MAGCGGRGARDRDDAARRRAREVFALTSTAFTELVGCRYPVQLAGMGGAMSDVALASAVTNAGGLGMLGAGGIPAQFLSSMLEALTGAARGPFGVNLLMPFLDHEALEIAAGRCRVVDFFYGDPDGSLVRTVHEGGALASWQVGSGGEARAAVDAGCDFVIAQGIDAGGHIRGQKPREALLAEVLDAVDVPVLAAGGIGTAAQVKAAIDAGAAGVRCGTVFLAATESSAHPDYVDALVGASAADTVVTEAFGVGWPDAPHRVLRSSLDAAEAAAEDVVGTMPLGPMEVPVLRFSVMAPTAGTTGNVAAMCMYAGTSVDAVTGRRPAAEIVAELCGDL